MSTPYRIAAADAAEVGRPSALAYYPLRRGHGSSMTAWVTVLLPPLLAGVGVGLLGAGELAVPAMIGTGLGLWGVRRRAKARPAVVLHVDDRVLRATGPSGREITSVHLDDLVDLGLETKTIEMVQESPGPVPELMYVNSTVGPALDTARIQIVSRRGEVVPLTDDFMPHSDSLEWRGKMRQFLRKHAWAPDEPPAKEAARPSEAKRLGPALPEPEIVEDARPTTTLELPRREAE